MGIFDKFKTSSIKLENEKEAAAALILCCVAADGEISEEEVNTIIAIATSRKLFKFDNYNIIHKKALDVVRSNKGNISQVINMASSLISSQNKHGIFSVCCDLVFSDGTIADEEERVIEAIQQALAISPADTEKIIQVVMWKNSF